MKKDTNNVEIFEVNAKDLTLEYIKNNLHDITKLRITGKKILNSKELNYILLYTNIVEIEAYDIETIDENISDINIIIRKNIEFTSKRFNKYQINKIKGYDKKNITIELPLEKTNDNISNINEEEDFKLLLKYIKEIDTINIKISSTEHINDAIKIIYQIEEHQQTKINNINIVTPNKSYQDINKLKFLEDDRKINIIYEEGIKNCTIDEYMVMRNNIDKIVNEISKKQLSNFENVIYAYDLVKMMNYHESQDNYSMEGRQLHKIFTNNNIVCSGFSKLLSQILNELGITASSYKMLTAHNNLHTRALVHIIDNKYQINHIYSLEPTWESNLSNKDSYALFLTPIEKVKESFPLEKYRSDIDILNGEKRIEETTLNSRISLIKLFNNKHLTQDYIEEIMSQALPNITLDKFIEALIKVRVAEGYANDKININEIIETNKNLIDMLNQKMQTNLKFFK